MIGGERDYVILVYKFVLLGLNLYTMRSTDSRAIKAVAKNDMMSSLSVVS